MPSESASQTDTGLVPKPSHPDADALAAAMRALHVYSEETGDPLSAVKAWVDPNLLMRAAAGSRENRRNAAGQAEGSLQDRALGDTSYLFGFCVAASLLDPERPLGPSVADGAGAAETGADTKTGVPSLADLALAFSSTPALFEANRRVSEKMAGAANPQAWEARVRDLIDPDSLQWAAMQSAMQVCRTETGADLMRLTLVPGGRERLGECVVMFIDGFLLGAHLPGLPGRAR